MDRAPRDKRPREVMGVSVHSKSTIAELQRVRLTLVPQQPYPTTWRPQTRADCAEVPRPCPYVSCTHHLYITVNRTGLGFKMNFPDIEPWEMKHSCVLDEADKGKQTLNAVGECLNLTRERVRQIQKIALAKLEPHVRGT